MNGRVDKRKFRQTKSAVTTAHINTGVAKLKFRQAKGAVTTAHMNISVAKRKFWQAKGAVTTAHMNVSVAKLLVSSLLLAAGLGVLAGAVQARSTVAKKSTHSTSRHKKYSRKSRHRERGQKAPTPDRIAEIQQALAKNGAYTGTPNGKWDDSTEDALRKFQESHGLNATGKLDARTLQQLGL